MNPACCLTRPAESAPLPDKAVLAGFVSRPVWQLWIAGVDLVRSSCLRAITGSGLSDFVMKGRFTSPVELWLFAASSLRPSGVSLEPSGALPARRLGTFALRLISRICSRRFRKTCDDLSICRNDTFRFFSKCWSSIVRRVW